jgi:glyoxylase-like metal-dependent hydrolase (beta-lactamase superfamily II)
MNNEWPTAATELAPGIFSYVQATGGFCIANAGIIDDPRGATVIDALFTPAMTRALLDQAESLATSPVARLINTHHHVDHTLGNARFPAATEILAHARARSEMERVGIGVLAIIKRIAPHFESDLEGATERLPDATFDGDALELEIGGRRVRLLHFGTGHTRGDVVVHLPEERVLFAGDVAFFNVTPLAFEGHIGNWMAICDRVLSMDDVDVIVPGHGPVGDKGHLREMRGYLQIVYDGARRALEAGASEDDARASIDLGPYAAWNEPERLSFNVARVYAEFRGELDVVL